MLLSFFQELPNNGVMLVYVSSDGCPGSMRPGEEGKHPLALTEVKCKKNKKRLLKIRGQLFKQLRPLLKTISGPPNLLISGLF